MSDKSDSEAAGDTRVFLVKFEAIGQKVLEKGRTINWPFVSRNALIAAPDREPYATSEYARMKRLSEELVAKEGGRVVQTEGRAEELSREHLLELAEKARPRDVIAAERQRLREEGLVV